MSALNVPSFFRWLAKLSGGRQVGSRWEIGIPTYSSTIFLFHSNFSLISPFPLPYLVPSYASQSQSRSMRCQENPQWVKPYSWLLNRYGHRSLLPRLAVLVRCVSKNVHIFIFLNHAVKNRQILILLVHIIWRNLTRYSNCYVLARLAYILLPHYIARSDLLTTLNRNFN